MFEMEKPLPSPNEDTDPFWAACRKGELALPTCGACQHRFLPPAPICPACLSDDVSLRPASGRGRVHTWNVVHKPQHPAFFEDAPYNVAIVQLDEGPRLHTRLVGIANDAIAHDLEVEVVFRKASDEIHLPLFKPVGVDVDV